MASCTESMAARKLEIRLSAGVLAGVIIGVILSIGWLIHISARPKIPILGRKPETDVFMSADEEPDIQTYAGVAIVRFDGGLFFASADSLQERLAQLAQEADPPLRMIVIDLEGVNYIDSQGADTVAQLLTLASARDIELRLARVKSAVWQVLQRDGVIGDLGEDHVYGNVYAAVADLDNELRSEE